MIEASLFYERPIVKGSKGIIIGEFQGRRVESEISYAAYDRPKFVSDATTSGNVNGKNTCEFILTEKGAKVIWRIFTRQNPQH